VHVQTTLKKWSLELSLELANKLTLEPGLLAVQIKKIDFFIYINI